MAHGNQAVLLECPTTANFNLFTKTRSGDLWILLGGARRRRALARRRRAPTGSDRSKGGFFDKKIFHNQKKKISRSRGEAPLCKALHRRAPPGARQAEATLLQRPVDIRYDAEQRHDPFTFDVTHHVT